jgi:hypothetical protein
LPSICSRRLKRDSRRVGADHHPDVKPMLRAYLAGGDCHLVAAQIPW